MEKTGEFVKISGAFVFAIIEKEQLEAIIVGTIALVSSVCGGAIVSFINTRSLKKKTNAETESIKVNNDIKVQNFYEKAAVTFKAEYEKVIEDYKNLQSKYSELNLKLESMNNTHKECERKLIDLQKQIDKLKL